MLVFFRQFRNISGQNPAPTSVTAWVVLFLILTVLGPMLTPYDPLIGDIAHALQPPSWAHGFGTDELGRDVLSRVMVAVRLDLGIAVAAVILSCVIGSGLGSLAGFYGGWTDWTAGRVIDVITAFPLFVLAIGIVAALGNSVVHMIYAMAIINLPVYIRVSRVEMNRLRDAGFITSARLYDSNDAQLLARALLPNILPAIMDQIRLSIGWTILHVVGVSFIGLGAPSLAPSWGGMIAEGAPLMITGQWWLALCPGMALMLVVLGCHMMLGGGLRYWIDPRT